MIGVATPWLLRFGRSRRGVLGQFRKIHSAPFFCSFLEFSLSRCHWFYLRPHWAPTAFFSFFSQANFENVPYRHKLQSYVFFFFLKLQTAAQGHYESIRIFFFLIIFKVFLKNCIWIFFLVMNARTQIHKTSSQLNQQQVWHVRTIVLEWDVSYKMYP